MQQQNEDTDVATICRASDLSAGLFGCCHVLRVTTTTVKTLHCTIATCFLELPIPGTNQGTHPTAPPATLSWECPVSLGVTIHRSSSGPTDYGLLGERSHRCILPRLSQAHISPSIPTPTITPHAWISCLYCSTCLLIQSPSSRWYFPTTSIINHSQVSAAQL